MAKKVEIEQKEGESLARNFAQQCSLRIPLAPERKLSSATRSPRGKAPKTPAMFREFCETKLDSERKRTTNAPEAGSEIEAPYELPEGWKWVRLGDVFSVNPGVKAADDLLASFIPMEKIEPNNTNKFSFSDEQWGKIKKNHTQFQNGDVCFAKISPCFENGKAFVAKGLENGIGAGTTELIVLRNQEIDSKYAFYFVSDSNFIKKGKATYSGTVGQQRISGTGKSAIIEVNFEFSFKNCAILKLNKKLINPYYVFYSFNLHKELILKEVTRGGAQPFLSLKMINNLTITYPSLLEQQEIIRILDTVLGKERTVKSSAEQVLEQMDLLKKSILARAFRGEL